MCLIALGRGVSAEWPLVVAANRDEVKSRPTTVMTTLRAAAPAILGGKDLEAGGTWMAVSEHGVVAALTNHPGMRDPAHRSRGLLPLLLAQARTAKEALDALDAEPREPPFGACYLLVADRAEGFYVDMSQPGNAGAPQSLTDGWTVLENRPLGATSEKADRMRSHLRQLSDGDLDHWAEQLQKALSDRDSPTPRPFDAILVDAVLNRAVLGDAVGDLQLAYGTRSSNIALVPAAGKPELYYVDGPPDSAPRRRATWPSSPQDKLARR